MRVDFRLAGWRCLSALTAVLGSASLALAQFTTAQPLPKGKPLDPPAATAVAPAAAKCVVEAAPAADLAPRVARTRWLSWPRWLHARHQVVADPCDHCGKVVPTAEELRRVESGQASMVEVAAAKIKADEAAAPGRRAAIRYLASVKCHYFPEAEAALVAALRADRNECVRLDAAQALADCCCCTPRTMEALLMAVSGSERDGNPAEVSLRVKSAANQALQRYAAQGMQVPHPDTLPAATQPAPQTAPPKELQLTNFTTPPLTVRPVTTAITQAELHFAETAGVRAAAGSSIPKGAPAPAVVDRPSVATAGAGRTPSAARAVSALPEIRLRPIGVIAPPETR